MSFERFDPGVSVREAPIAAQAALSVDRTPAQQSIRLEIDQLDQFERPEGFSEARWYTLLRDARSFTERWLDIALACGWTLHDLYAFRKGAIFMMDGREVSSVGHNRIVIVNIMGDDNTFCRQSPAVSIPFDRTRYALVWDALRLAKAGAAI